MNAIERLRATYEFRPVDRLVRKEFFVWGETIQRWASEGMVSATFQQDCLYDDPAKHSLCLLGWCEPAFVPAIEEKVLEDQGPYQIVLDTAGRIVKRLAGRRRDFMPTFLKHAVTGDADWEQDILPRLQPDTPQRLAAVDREAAAARKAAAKGLFLSQQAIGGYMYLRALVGPEEICYLFLDNPRLVHRMMRAWLSLLDSVTARVQQTVELDEIFLAEDICYNHGLLISPDMVREFLFPYYQQLVANARKRQKRRIWFHVDTDGFVGEALPLYRSVGLDAMEPFEVAAGNDLVEIAGKNPDLVMSGGIDKRILAAGREAIDEYLGRVMPFMVKRGGFIPTCDHGVPHDVSWANYLYYRRRMAEMDH